MDIQKEICFISTITSVILVDKKLAKKIFLNNVDLCPYFENSMYMLFEMFDEIDDINNNEHILKLLEKLKQHNNSKLRTIGGIVRWSFANKRK